MNTTKQTPFPFVDGTAPEGWTRITHTSSGDRYSSRQRIYRREDGLQVTVQLAYARDDSVWTHVTYGYETHTPDWDVTKLVKETFIGKDRKAIQVLPCEAEYVNIHPHTLHLWSPCGIDPVPDLRNEDGCL